MKQNNAKMNANSKQNSVIIETAKGSIKGIVNNRYCTFLGIPYAYPPIAERRWKAPEPINKWQGVLDATCCNMNKCPQEDLSQMELYGQEFYSDKNYDLKNHEDCLYLNIYCPRNVDDTKKPVVIWIHGGAFDHGHAYEKEFDGKIFAENGIVFVSINYRLGVFGFLAVEEYLKRDGHAGNYGLLDQIEAIRFVKANIEAFGGDPMNITLMGQSAGAFSIQALWRSRLTEGLFQKIILQSGCGQVKGLKTEQSLEDAFVFSKKLMSAVGVNDIHELEHLSSEQLLHTYQKIKDTVSPLPLGPTIDGFVLDQSVEYAFTNGTIPAYPCLIGCNSEDIFYEQPSASGKGIYYDQIIWMRDQLRAQHKIDPILYYFSHSLPGDHAGAFHSAELWYIFDTMERCWRPWQEDDIHLAKEMQAIWCTFIKNGSIEGCSMKTQCVDGIVQFR